MWSEINSHCVVRRRVRRVGRTLSRLRVRRKPEQREFSRNVVTTRRAPILWPPTIAPRKLNGPRVLFYFSVFNFQPLVYIYIEHSVRGKIIVHEISIIYRVIIIIIFLGWKWERRNIQWERATHTHAHKKKNRQRVIEKTLIHYANGIKTKGEIQGLIFYFYHKGCKSWIQKKKPFLLRPRGRRGKKIRTARHEYDDVAAAEQRVVRSENLMPAAVAWK